MTHFKSVEDICQLSRGISKSYIVCSTGRSGSTLLCRTLKTFRFLGSPQEYFLQAVGIQITRKTIQQTFIRDIRTF